MKYEVTSYNTKRLLADSLKAAMARKPFSKITVSELIRYCGVNRKTFYYHFQDTYDLLKWVLDEEAIRVVKHFDLLTDYAAAIRFVMDYAAENGFLVSCVSDPAGREEIKHFFCADLTAVVRSVIDEAEALTGAVLEPEFKEYTAKFYTEALACMLIDWLREKNRRDREQTVRYLTDIIAAAVESMLTHLERRQPPTPA